MVAYNDGVRDDRHPCDEPALYEELPPSCCV